MLPVWLLGFGLALLATALVLRVASFAVGASRDRRFPT
jgi:hypothetical protein